MLSTLNTAGESFKDSNKVDEIQKQDTPISTLEYDKQMMDTVESNTTTHQPCIPKSSPSLGGGVLDQNDDAPADVLVKSNATVLEVQKKKRGRKKKVCPPLEGDKDNRLTIVTPLNLEKLDHAEIPTGDQSISDAVKCESATKKKRGRKPKQKTQEIKNNEDLGKLKLQTTEIKKRKVAVDDNGVSFSGPKNSKINSTTKKESLLSESISMQKTKRNLSSGTIFQTLNIKIKTAKSGKAKQKNRPTSEMAGTTNNTEIAESARNKSDSLGECFLKKLDDDDDHEASRDESDSEPGNVSAKDKIITIKRKGWEAEIHTNEKKPRKIIELKDTYASSGVSKKSDANSHNIEKNEKRKKKKPKARAELNNGKTKTKDGENDSDNDKEDGENDSENDSDNDEEDSDNDEDDYVDEEEEYINSLDESVAADLYEYQDRLYNLKSSRKPLRFQILEGFHPDDIKSRLLKLLDSTYENTYGGEYSKNIKFIESVLKLPLGIYVNENIPQADIRSHLKESRIVLDKAVYGHKECKEYILQIIAQHISKQSPKGKVFAIQGPPGNGKTSLIRNGICKALNRPFSMIALGGISDGSLMEGHDFTYEGSMWGKLAQCLMDAKCMNPVIYFDELDKVSETMQGQEIIGILTHLVDFTQNDKIRDRYFNGIDLDFSRCIFIFSFNDANAINAILMDRIQIFHTTGFTDDEKVTISLDYLLPEIIQNFSIGTSDVIVPRDIIMYILKKYAKQQEGVRDIKKILELLLLHLNYQYLTCSSDESSTDIKMPFTMTTSFVDKCLSRLAGQKDTFQNIYM